MKNFILVVVFLFTGFFLINYNSRNSGVKNINSVRIGGIEVKVEIVSTPEARAQGLSGREGLGASEGMLFVFDVVGRHTFWMKDMKFAIDIIWINEKGEIIYIKENATPESYPSIFNPDQDAKYVLEIPAGFSKQNKLKVGYVVEFTY